MKSAIAISLTLSIFAIAAWIAIRPVPASTEEKTAQASQLEKVILKVEGMTCGGCAVGVKKTLEKQKGVRKAEVSLEKGEAVAEVEKGKIKPEDLAAAVTKFGYKASVQKRKGEVK